MAQLFQVTSHTLLRYVRLNTGLFLCSLRGDLHVELEGSPSTPSDSKSVSDDEGESDEEGDSTAATEEQEDLVSEDIDSAVSQESSMSRSMDLDPFYVLHDVANEGYPLLESLHQQKEQSIRNIRQILIEGETWVKTF